MTPRVFVLGAGHAGRALAHAMRVGGVDVVGLHGRREDGEPRSIITYGALPPSFAQAEVVLVTVRDRELDDVLRSLLEASLRPGAVMLHASGSMEPAALDALREAGHSGGTFHPLLPLTDPTRATEQLRRAWIGIDGDEAARVRARELAAAIGAQVLEIPPGQKARYHAAAVISSNFPIVLLALATRLLAESGIPEDAARSALRTLLDAASDNLRTLAPYEALTGPVARADVGVVRTHLAALADDPGVLEVYRVLSREAIPLAEQQGADRARLEELRRALS